MKRLKIILFLGLIVCTVLIFAGCEPEEYEDAEEELADRYEIWIEGDVEAHAEKRKELIEEAETESLKEFQAAFTDERDQQMTDRIEELLHDQTGHTYFITVGSMHLVGDNSIVDRLEERGFEVENMY